jgi:hypothetical protein
MQPLIIVTFVMLIIGIVIAAFSDNNSFSQKTGAALIIFSFIMILILSLFL